MHELGRMLAVLGGGLLLLGLVLMAIGRLPGVGRLPGDIIIEREGFTCVVPLATMILVSLLLTLILNVFARLLNRGP
ncbi:MAG: DUF2905 domain-containing protein [Chloroflexota bacterium]|nr:DUF2905 domain-containing protein [Dehalococcoidia bacterium]MDW8254491.1 DUF2905 domain-containing protein [Chloroflexota bacterium]